MVKKTFVLTVKVASDKVDAQHKKISIPLMYVSNYPHKQLKADYINKK